MHVKWVGQDSCLLIWTYLLLRKRCRGGKSKISLLYINARGKDSLLKAADKRLLSAHSITMLSETWCTPEKFKPCIENKTVFYSGATKSAKMGRPMGGLETYANPSMGATLISNTDHHISVNI